MSFLQRLIGLDTDLMSEREVTKPERKVFKTIGILLVMAIVISFLGTLQLGYFIAKNMVLSIFGACFWTLVYVNMYRLLLVNSVSRSDNVNSLTFENMINGFFIAFFSIVGTAGFIAICYHHFFYTGLKTGEPVGIINGVLMAFEALNNKSGFVFFVVFFGLGFGMTLPFIFMVSSSKIKWGGYARMLRQQTKDMILGNYIVFKSDYPKVLMDAIQTSKSLKQLEDYDFYEPYEDAPFNTVKKIEW